MFCTLDSSTRKTYFYEFSHGANYTILMTKDAKWKLFAHKSTTPKFKPLLDV
jgi:hypothetical protein